MTYRTLLTVVALWLPAPLSAQDLQSNTTGADNNLTVLKEGVEVTLPDGVSHKDIGKRDLQVLMAQVLLDRSSHSPGVVDGYMGGNTQRAIRYYRMANDLPEGSALDEELIRSLLGSQGSEVFSRYTITDNDVAGPFENIPSEFESMAELDELGYTSPREKLAERFHMDEKFLAALNPHVNFSEAGTKINIVAFGDDKIRETIERIEVRKDDNTIAVFGSNGQIVASYPATIGSDEFPSPSGNVEVNAIAPKPAYYFDPEGREWGPDENLKIAPGPNNPIGGTWIDLSKEGYGIHGSPDPSKIAKRASHGCVRLTNWDANQLAEAVSPGIPVKFM